MGYFSNGTEAVIFEEMYCVRCVHSDWREGKEIGDADNPCCPVFNAHFLYGYTEYHNDPTVQSILDMLIKPDDSGDNVCAMFAAKPDAVTVAPCPLPVASERSEP